MSNLPHIIENKFGFIQITLEELLELRKAGVLSTQTYITMCLKFEQPYMDKPLTINVDEFTKKWGINKRTYYKCINKLKESGMFIIQKLQHVCEWSGVQQTRKVIDEQKDTLDEQKDTLDEQKDTLVNNRSQPKPEALENQETNSPKDINTINNNLKEDKCTNSAKEQMETSSDDDLVMPDKPHRHEPLIQFVTNEFQTKYGEEKEKARRNAIAHLSNIKKAKKKWDTYLNHIQAKKRQEERNEMFLNQRKEMWDEPVNLNVLQKLAEFAQSLKMKT